METPSGPQSTPEQRIPEHLRLFLATETVAGHFGQVSHGMGGKW